MQKANVSFDFEGRIVKIQCSTDDKMKDICQKYANKIQRNVNSLIFLYGGSNLNFQLSFKEQTNIIDKERNEMSVLVYKSENDLSCPKCGEKINLNSDKVNDIKSSINNINDTVKGLKFNLENIIRISTEEMVKVQLKNVNLVFNTLNEDIKKLNKKFDDLLNVTNINKELNLSPFTVSFILLIDVLISLILSEFKFIFSPHLGHDNSFSFLYTDTLISFLSLSIILACSLKLN